jgi:hypothetical protein
MFEREIQRAKELLTHRMTTPEQFVYWDDVRQREEIPVFYRNFFGAEVQWWIFEQQMQRSANPRFDYAHESLAQSIADADRARMEAARFDHQDLISTIDIAVKTRLNYVLRPRTTLKWFVYRGEPTKTLHEVMLRMDYFLEYDYLLDGFRKWAATKQHERNTAHTNIHFSAGLVSVVEFDRVLQSVDNEVILEYSPEEFIDLLTPMYEMFDEIHATDRTLQQYKGKVPTPALIVFLDDKGIHRISQALERLMKSHTLRYVGQREFLHILNDIVTKLDQTSSLSSLPPVLAAIPTFEDPITLPLDFGEPPANVQGDGDGDFSIPTQKLNGVHNTAIHNDEPEDAFDSFRIVPASPSNGLSKMVSTTVADSPPLDKHEHEREHEYEHELDTEAFGTELSSLTAMMAELDAPSVAVPPELATEEANGQDSSRPTTVFSRWSSIFSAPSPRAEE